MKMERIESSETSALKAQTPGDYTKTQYVNTPCVFFFVFYNWTYQKADSSIPVYSVYRVIQEERPIFSERVVSVIVTKEIIRTRV